MAITLHEGTTFLLSQDLGDLIAGEGRGLFHQDTRFLRRLQLLLDDRAPIPLTSRVPRHAEAVHFLTNPTLSGAPRGTLVLIRRHLVGDGLHADFEVENYGDDRATFSISLGFETDFVHIFTVKHAVESGLVPQRPPELRVRLSDDGRSVLLEIEREGVLRATRIDFSEPAELSSDRAVFRIDLPRRGTWRLCLDVSLQMGSSSVRPRYTCKAPTDPERNRARIERGQELRELVPTLQTDHPVLLRAYRQATSDLISLRILGEDACREYTLAAGIPWFMAVFGRDSLIASYQTLLHDPSLARGTLQVLARLQGTKVDEVASEEPGKILHEYRRGVDASARKLIPKFPYYGTIDATPLFIVVLSEYARCTGDLDLVRELWGNVERAVEWVENYGDRDGDGLLEYESKVGLSNQGWKDSYDSVRFRDGRIAQAPVALVEVQGYAFDALSRCAELAAHLGHGARAEELRARADRMRERILSRYWIAQRGYFAEALDGKKRPVDAFTSNPGHLLWSGVVPPQQAKKVADVLLSPDMFSGYGIRTMSAADGGYNPISYHNGSIWPHDNSLIVAGLSRYDLRREAATVVSGLLDALAQYADDRLPELFAGHPKDRFDTPVEYPTANRPQAWASGALISLVRSIFGLDVDALNKRVALRPLVLPGLGRLSLSGIRIGGHPVELELAVRDRKPSARIGGLPGDWQIES